MNILGAEDVNEAISRYFVGLEDYLIGIIFDSADHALAATHYFVLLYALEHHLETQQEVQNVLISLSFILEENRSVFLLDSYLLLGLSLLEVLGHFPVFQEKSLEGILGFEVVAHHEFVLDFFVLSEEKSTSMI